MAIPGDFSLGIAFRRGGVVGKYSAREKRCSSDARISTGRDLPRYESHAQSRGRVGGARCATAKPWRGVTAACWQRLTKSPSRETEALS